MSTVNAIYFGMTKIELNALVATGEPHEVNGAQAELDRRRANKAAKRANRELIEQERLAQAGSEEEVTTVNEPVAE
jgi:hypothetical protein